MIICRSLSQCKMRNKILPTYLQGNYRDNLGEFSNTSDGVFWAERVNYGETKWTCGGLDPCVIAKVLWPRVAGINTFPEVITCFQDIFLFQTSPISTKDILDCLM